LGLEALGWASTRPEAGKTPIISTFLPTESMMIGFEIQMMNTSKGQPGTDE